MMMMMMMLLLLLLLTTSLAISATTATATATTCVAPTAEEIAGYSDAAAVFVTSAAASLNPSGPFLGTRAFPFSSLAAALPVAAGRPILLTFGVHHHNATIDSPAALLGGLDASFHVPATPPPLNSSSSIIDFSASSIAVFVTISFKPCVVISSVVLSSSSNPFPHGSSTTNASYPGNSVGIFVAASTLLFINSSVLVPAGARGTDGAVRGFLPVIGTNGVNSSSGSTVVSPNLCTPVNCNCYNCVCCYTCCSCTNPASTVGGSGGALTCPGSGVVVRGGDGGAGAVGLVSGYPGQAASGTGSGQGGIGAPPLAGNANPRAASIGADGAAGADGSPGVPVPAIYRFTAAGLAVDLGSVGGYGKPGGSGGGGGGGGGGGSNTSVPGKNCNCPHVGSGGSGGGSGGCPGQGGMGSTSGGGSFGIYATASSTLQFLNAIVVAGPGGVGGIPQAGAPGGRGGAPFFLPGTNKGSQNLPANSSCSASLGARGGYGGAGGRGGPGSQGEVGPSVAIILLDGSVITEADGSEFSFTAPADSTGLGQGICSGSSSSALVCEVGFPHISSVTPSTGVFYGSQISITGSYFNTDNSVVAMEAVGFPAASVVTVTPTFLSATLIVVQVPLALVPDSARLEVPTAVTVSIVVIDSITLSNTAKITLAPCGAGCRACTSNASACALCFGIDGNGYATSSGASGSVCDGVVCGGVSVDTGGVLTCISPPVVTSIVSGTPGRAGQVVTVGGSGLTPTSVYTLGDESWNSSCAVVENSFSLYGTQGSWIFPVLGGAMASAVLTREMSIPLLINDVVQSLVTVTVAPDPVVIALCPSSFNVDEASGLLNVIGANFNTDYSATPVQCRLRSNSDTSIVFYSVASVLTSEHIICPLAWTTQAHFDFLLTVTNDGFARSSPPLLYAQNGNTPNSIGLNATVKLYTTPVALVFVQTPSSVQTSPFSALSVQPVLAIVDNRTEVVSEAFLQVFAKVVSPGNPTDPTPLPVVDGVVRAEEGVATFYGLAVTAPYGASYLLWFEAIYDSATTDPVVLRSPSVLVTLPSCGAFQEPYAYSCACQPGYEPRGGGSSGGQDGTVAECVPCLNGFYKPYVGNENCLGCPDLLRQDTGGNIASVSASACQCLPTLYLPPGQSTCQPCLEGGVCLGGDLIAVQSGYYRPAKTAPYQIYECPLPYACAGTLNRSAAALMTNTSSSCARGYQSLLCSVCDAGYGSVGNWCSKCPHLGVAAVGVIILLLILMLLCFAMIRVAHMEDARRRTAVIVKTFVNHLHVLAIIGTYNVGWSENIQALFTIPRLSTLSSKAYTLDCTSAMTFYNRLILMYVSPIIVFAAVAVVYLVRYCYFAFVLRLSLTFRKDIVPNMQVALIVSLFLLWPSITTGLMDVFICTDVAGVRVVTSDTRVQCSGPQYQTFYTVSMLYFILCCIGAPLALFLFMRHYRAVQTGKFRIVTIGYRKRYWYNDFVILLRKLCLIFTIAAPGPLQPLIASIILVFSLHLHLSLQPFAEQHQRRLHLGGLETWSITVCLITSQFGLYFVFAGHSSPSYGAASWIVFVTNLLLIVFFVYYIVTYVRKTEDVVGNFLAALSRMARSRFRLRDNFWAEDADAAGSMVRMDDDKL